MPNAQPDFPPTNTEDIDGITYYRITGAAPRGMNNPFNLHPGHILAKTRTGRLLVLGLAHEIYNPKGRDHAATLVSAGQIVELDDAA